MPHDIDKIARPAMLLHCPGSTCMHAYSIAKHLAILRDLNVLGSSHKALPDIQAQGIAHDDLLCKPAALYDADLGPVACSRVLH